MSLWLLLTLIGLVKLAVASLMLWLPFRSDTAMSSIEHEARPDSDDDGGTKMLPGKPSEPHPKPPFPHRPRRGPHSSPSSPSPARVRATRLRIVARPRAQR